MLKNGQLLQYYSSKGPVGEGEKWATSGNPRVDAYASVNSTRTELAAETR